MAARHGYDAFISYNHQADRELATRLQPALEGFARRRTGRSLRMFRDDAVLGAGPDLTEAIRQAMRESEWFILLASPEAAGSAWVDAEVSWWLQEKGPERLLIALTDGEIAWDAGRGRLSTTRTDALPPSLVEAMDVEPKFVDARPLRGMTSLGTENASVADVVAQLVAPIRAVPKDDLIGWQAEAAVQERRRTRTVVTVLAALLALAVATTTLAWNQLAVNTSRLLAATALETAGSDAALARLLAAEAYTRAPGPASYGALVDVMTDDQELVGGVDVAGEIMDVVGARDGRHVVGVVADPPGRQVAGGTVSFFRWDTTDGSIDRSGAARLPHPWYPGEHVQDLAVSTDGSTVVAADATVATVWHGEDLVDRRVATDGRQIAALGVSPTGSYVALILVDTEDGGDPFDAVLRPAVLSIRSAEDLTEVARTELRGSRSSDPDGETYGVGTWADDRVFTVVAGPALGWQEYTLTGSALVPGKKSDGRERTGLLSDVEIDHFADENGGSEPDRAWAADRADHRVVSESVRAQARIDPYNSGDAVREAQLATSEVWFDAFAYASSTTGAGESSLVGPAAGPSAVKGYGDQAGLARLSDSGWFLLFPNADGARVVELSPRADPRPTRQWHLPGAVQAGRGDFLGSDAVVTADGGRLTLWRLKAPHDVVGPGYESILGDYLANGAVGDDVPPALALDSRRGLVALVSARRALLVAGADDVAVLDLPTAWFASVPVWLPDGRLILARATGGLAEVDLDGLMRDGHQSPKSLRPIGDTTTTSEVCDVVVAARADRADRVTVAHACGGSTELSTENGAVLGREESGCRGIGVMGLDGVIQDEPDQVSRAEVARDHHPWLTRLSQFGLFPDGAVYTSCDLSVFDVDDLVDTDAVALGQDTLAIADGPELQNDATATDLTLWNRADGKRLFRAERSGDLASGIALVPGTTYVAYPRVDTGELVIVDMETGETATTLRVPYAKSDRVLQAGDQILSYSARGGLQAWDLRPDTLVRQACESADRDLTSKEWAAVVGWVPSFDLTCGRGT